jgi:hypothetical protein
MIKYALKCADGHDFESWFPNSGSFDQQLARAQVVCPICATTDVSKAIMAPAIAHADRIEPPLSDRDKQIAALRALRHYVMGVTENVGLRFPDEARKIAEGFSEERPIRGQATRDEAKALLDEGIAILPLPLVPGDLN